VINQTTEYAEYIEGYMLAMAVQFCALFLFRVFKQRMILSPMIGFRSLLRSCPY